MKAVINEIKSNQKKLVALLEEYRHAKKFEAIRQRHEVFFILDGGYVWQYPTMRAAWCVSDGEVRTFLHLRRAVARGCVLDLEGRLKRVYKHRSRGKK